MLGGSSYDVISTILEEVYKEESIIETDKLRNNNFIDALLVISSLVDKNDSTCSECLGVKNKILSLSKKLKDIIKYPKQYIGYQQEYNEIIVNFLEHFCTRHNNLKEISSKGYNCRDYYCLRVIYELEIIRDRRRLKKISKRYDIDYLSLAFLCIIENLEAEGGRYRELNQEMNKFIFNLFETEGLETLANDYLNLVKQLAILLEEERNEDYNLYYDLTLLVKGRDIIEEEESRKKRSKFINILYILDYNKHDNKYLLKLTTMAFNIEGLARECEFCNQLKRKLTFSLEEIETFKSKKSKNFVAYKKFNKKYRKLIKNYKNHFKNYHNKFDVESFDQKIITPLVYLIAGIIGIFSAYLADEYNLPGRLIMIIFILAFVFVEDKVEKKVLKLICKTKDVF
ncbi:hypothetical protein [Orenia marismortui]|uniref:Uncharacterized protein n=1 Tax=Orenia marismortui TaxID=46469 RepID=A0A4R8GJC8_9FIRM|nr:hypothetical protein [Orenia marismortui]TDX44498.1 hypothetical protein C7959_1524 [Orenia marismortui]